MAITQGHKLDGNTLALWRLDETTAGTALADANGRYGGLSLSGGTPTVVSGLVADNGKARNFADASLYSGTGDAALTTALQGEFTVEAWFKLDAYGDTRFFQVNASVRMIVVDVTAGGKLEAFWLRSAAFQDWVDNGPQVLALGQRYHLAARKKSLGGGNFRIDLFINGVLASSGGSLLNTDATGTPTISIGTVGVAPSGTIDDVRLSSVARTDAEIADSYWRGLLDTSPGATVAPFRQTRTPYQDFHRQLSPTALLNPQGAAFEAAQGSLKDAMFDRCLQSVKAKYPSVAPGDALAAIGADRMMPRGGSETDAAYAARLLNAWNTWPWAGTAYGLLQAFWGTGYRNVVLAQVRGGKQFTLDQGGTNLLQWSNYPVVAPWSSSGGDLGRTINATAAPDGTTTATKMFEATTANVEHFIEQTIAIAASLSGTYAVYAKAAERTWLFLSEVLRDSTNVPGIYFDLTNGVLGTISSGGGVTPTGKITAIGNGWYRCEFTGSVGVGGTNPRIRIQLASANGTKVYAGTVNSGLYLADCSVEQSPGPAGPYVQTYANAIASTLGAGSLLISSMGSGAWTPTFAADTFWSRFDVIFELPLLPATWGWSGGIPSSSSTEANFIRSLIQAWKPAHATPSRIIIVQQGGVWGCLDGTWGDGDAWGGTTTVWTP